MSSFETVGIVGKRRDPQVVPTLMQLLEILRALGRRVRVEDVTLAGVDLPDDVQRLPRAQLATACDLVVVVGGDGTLLSAARDLAPAGVALVGINQGRLGFMVDVPPAEMREALTAVFAGDYVREQRLLLSTRLIRERRPQLTQLAVNDVVIRNQAAIRMLEFETWIDGEFISQHRADGFIVASPTGSTAYALSGGGPVVHPGLDALTLVPICPHTLSDRPIVVSSRQTVRITLRGAPNTVAMYTCDSQTAETLHVGESFEVREADFRMHLVHPRQYSYFDILRSKLNWGRGPALNAGSAEGNIR
ncbi:MAG TPA: NAD(+) kinase, partial [Solimonas sp.]|nr:NAD(+) kinase [Solimonas sp.]